MRLFDKLFCYEALDHIFSDRETVQSLLHFEAALARAEAQAGVIPQPACVRLPLLATPSSSTWMNLPLKPRSLEISLSPGQTTYGLCRRGVIRMPRTSFIGVLPARTRLTRAPCCNCAARWKQTGIRILH